MGLYAYTDIMKAQMPDLCFGYLTTYCLLQLTTGTISFASALVSSSSIARIERVSAVLDTTVKTRTSTTKLFSASHNDGRTNNEPDLFDYFDPLLSPHAYPNGISPTAKPLTDVGPPVKKTAFANPFGIDYMSQKMRGTEEPPSTPPAQTTKSSNQDLFDYFDPLLSPHAYPNGISPTNKKPQALEVVDEGYNPLKLNTDIISGTSRKRIGILLMDHGSRNPASNARLHHLAQLYQLSISDPSGLASASSSSSFRVESEIIVKAAHMEIATPSIPDGLKALMEDGVDEIVCHPYFLSPGRHVMEDIPQIVKQAIEDLSIEIPVITTEPVGSNTQLMIGAIHSLVRENSQLLRRQT